MRPAIRLFLIAVALFAAAAFSGGGIAAEQPRPPFDVAARQALLGKPADGRPCRPPPAPVHDLEFDGFYRAGSGSSEVDEKAMAAYRAARKPVDRFTSGVIAMGDRYVASRPADAAAARCALDWLHRWAEGDAFLGEASRQGGFVRKWALGTVSLAWLKIRDAAGLDAVKVAVVKRWIRDWAQLVHDDYSTGLHRSSRNNNHAYWAAWSVGIASVALDDWALFDWMVERYRAAMRQIADDGTLPRELDRRSKALHYHLFSVQALVMIAELGAANGENLYEAENGALHSLVRRTVEGLSDPGYFRRKTGYEQSWVGRLNGGMLAWMEPYYARFRTPSLRPWIDRFRPLKNRRIGGDATLLYGVVP